MFYYYIESLDKYWNLYIDELNIQQNIKNILKKWKILWKDSFFPKRTITKIIITKIN